MAKQHKIGALAIFTECSVGMWYVSLSSGKETLRFALHSADESEAKIRASLLADMIRSAVQKEVNDVL